MRRFASGAFGFLRPGCFISEPDRFSLQVEIVPAERCQFADSLPRTRQRGDDASKPLQIGMLLAVVNHCGDFFCCPAVGAGSASFFQGQLDQFATCEMPRSDQPLEYLFDGVCFEINSPPSVIEFFQVRDVLFQ